MQNLELESQLLALPLDEPVEIDGESVYLRVDRDGAELGVQVLHDATGEQLDEALRLGFQLALECEAGWALAPDGDTLLLTQWLPGAAGWTEAAEPLERLLNLVEQLRLLDPFAVGASRPPASRDEQRMRSRLLEGA